MSALAVLRHELLGYFWSPVGWIVLTLFLLVQGYSFYLLMEWVSGPFAPHADVLTLFFGGTLLFWLFAIGTVSAISMRLFAEERRSGTLEVLLAAPLSEWEIVLGKYGAALLFFGALWVPTLVYVLLVWQLRGEPPLDWGAVAAGYVGTMAVGATCLAVGLLCSALTRHQLVAALSTFVVLVLMLLLEPLQQVAHDPGLRAVVAHLSLFGQMEQFARGVVDSRHLVFDASVIALCLLASARVVAWQR